jgi:dihydrolipoamide dehydrogenase
MKFFLSHQVASARVGSAVEIVAKSGETETKFEGDAALVAIGRKPFTKDLGLEKVGIHLDSKGFIPIDASFRSQVPSIFAIGDIVNGPMLAHKASEEGVAVAELLAGKSPTIDYATIPSVAYTSPEVASVGFTEEELKAKKIPYKSGQFPFKANSRARCTGETDGFVKVLVEEPTKKLLGVHIIGAHASELIAEAVLALKLRLSALDVADACHAHPTLSEALKEAALAATKGALHL